MKKQKTPTYGLGHKDNLPDARDWKVGALLGVGGTAAPSKSAGVAQWASAPLDQGGTSSCVGHAIALQLYCRMSAAGISQVMPSPLEIYYNGRAINGDQGVDDGSRPRDVYRACRKHGYCAYDLWPTESRTPLEQPPWSVQRLSVDCGDLEYYAIDGMGESYAERIRQALHYVYPVTFAMDVDDSYMQYSGGLWKGMAGPRVGGHEQCALEYDELGVWVQNSWGNGWGVSGRAHIAWPVVEVAWRDATAVTFAPSPQRG